MGCVCCVRCMFAAMSSTLSEHALNPIDDNCNKINMVRNTRVTVLLTMAEIICPVQFTIYDIFINHHHLFTQISSLSARNLTIANIQRISCTHDRPTSMASISVTLNMGQRSLKVIGDGTIRQIAYEFLLAFHSTYGAILYRLRDIASYWSKIAKFLYCRSEKL